MPSILFVILAAHGRTHRSARKEKLRICVPRSATATSAGSRSRNSASSRATRSTTAPRSWGWLGRPRRDVHRLGGHRREGRVPAPAARGCRELVRDLATQTGRERAYGDGSTTWRENFTRFWTMWRDDINRRDWAWIRKTNPKGYTLESRMQAKGYRGLLEVVALLKIRKTRSRSCPLSHSIFARHPSPQS